MQVFVFIFEVNTVIITNFYYRTPMTHTMPFWLRKFFVEILPKCLRMKSPKFSSIQLERSIGLRHSNASMISYLNNRRRTSTILVQSSSFDGRRAYLLIEKRRSRRQLQIELMRRELVQALNHLQYIAEHCAQQTLIESVRDEWRLIATVIDRLQFIVFLAVTLIGSFALLFQVPDMFNFNTNDPQKLVRFSNPNTTVHETIPNIR